MWPRGVLIVVFIVEGTGIVVLLNQLYYFSMHLIRLGKTPLIVNILGSSAYWVLVHSSAEHRGESQDFLPSHGCRCVGFSQSHGLRLFLLYLCSTERSKDQLSKPDTACRLGSALCRSKSLKILAEKLNLSLGQPWAIAMVGIRGTSDRRAGLFHQHTVYMNPIQRCMNKKNSLMEVPCHI